MALRENIIHHIKILKKINYMLIQINPENKATHCESLVLPLFKTKIHAQKTKRKLCRDFVRKIIYMTFCMRLWNAEQICIY